MKRNYLNTASFTHFFVLLLLLTLSSGIYAQRSRPRSTPTVVTQGTEVRQAAEAVSIQVKNLSKFLFVLGGVAKGIEDIDKEIREGRATRELEDQNLQFKDDVLRSIRALRAGLVKLEVDFRAKPALRPYLVHIQGITEESGRAEDLAIAGQFTNAGKELLLTMEKLADVLVELPQR